MSGVTRLAGGFQVAGAARAAEAGVRKIARRMAISFRRMGPSFEDIASKRFDVRVTLPYETVFGKMSRALRNRSM
ncbi:hypothetical protein Aph02nite_26520 [Actinoplanes philippinensis]|nr:hypothetical protein Aph02nite_26520 [Actinoplanes philippinensis]